MSMEAYSILAGKSYRTPDNEIREVRGIDGADVIYCLIAAPAGRGIIGRSAEKRMPLAAFANEVESEVDIRGLGA